MNYKKLNAIISKLESAKSALEEMLEEMESALEKKRDSFDSKSEKWQESETGCKAYDAIETLESEIQYIGDAINSADHSLCSLGSIEME